MVKVYGYSDDVVTIEGGSYTAKVFWQHRLRLQGPSYYR